ncbi:hypothetical protein CCACVL1_02654 [Corchorus capsularis]|uniref:Uncharacterized protein n=1 Tax=Corchorus capsularis TaxID=210143 RepID=A0A1R3K777_COCAP|nr:hypothetical protein CCACVL1_02654 [Corchorus capsularis]
MPPHVIPDHSHFLWMGGDVGPVPGSPPIVAACLRPDPPNHLATSVGACVVQVTTTARVRPGTLGSAATLRLAPIPLCRRKVHGAQDKHRKREDEERKNAHGEREDIAVQQECNARGAGEEQAKDARKEEERRRPFGSPEEADVFKHFVHFILLPFGIESTAVAAGLRCYGQNRCSVKRVAIQHTHRLNGRSLVFGAADGVVLGIVQTPLADRAAWHELVRKWAGGVRQLLLIDPESAIGAVTVCQRLLPG